jgi:hypothetical protein
MVRRTVVFVVIFILLVITIANGADAKYAATFPDVVGGRRGNIYLGWRFSVNTPIKITAVGTADFDMDGIGYGPVWLWDKQEHILLGSYQLNNDNSVLEDSSFLVGIGFDGYMCQFRYMYLDTPVELYPGREYIIVGYFDNNRIVLATPFVPDEITFLDGQRYIVPNFPIWHSFDGWFGPNFKFESITQEVNIDIKPGSCPNPMNIKDKGVLPVSILGTEDFDVSTIDIASIRLEGVAPIRSSYEDITTPVPDDAEVCECTTERPDGYLDLTLKFNVQEIVAALGEVEDEEELELTLTGVLNDDVPIEGKDCIIVISKGKPE